MCVSSSLVELRLMSGGDKVFLVNEHGQWLPGAGGLYAEGESKFVIRIDRSELTNLSGLVGTIAHELAHVRLMGEGRMCGDEFDNELLTDLTVIWFGLGVFQANSPRNWDSSYTNWPGTDLKKPEYMTPPMFGWALAHLAWHRNEMKPGWARYLSSGAKANLKQGLQYLHKTNDSDFRP